MSADINDTADTSGQSKDLALSGSQNVAQLKAKMAQMAQMIELKKAFLRDQLKEGIDRDYAVVPGCGDRKVLLKPGAEKLLEWHNYYPDFKPVTEKEDWDIGLFAYVYRCEIKQRGTGIVISTSEGDASTFESKYRYEWKFEAQVPDGTDLKSLTQKVYKRRDGSTFIKYRLPVDDPADKRNTVRKMAQKRAFIGATVLATATSDLFTTDVDPDDVGNDAGGDEVKTTAGAKEVPKSDYGPPISEPRAKRLYAIRMNSKIDNEIFNKWLVTVYGLTSDREIGVKIYDDICKACESGKLELPEKKAAEPAKSEGKGAAHAAPGTKLSATQIKGIWDSITETGKDEKTFLQFLHDNYKDYANAGINDIMAADYEAIRQAFVAKMKGSLI